MEVFKSIDCITIFIITDEPEEIATLHAIYTLYKKGYEGKGRCFIVKKNTLLYDAIVNIMNNGVCFFEG